MRVIAGTAKRMALLAPKGQHTRPTADRIKENLFNIIGPYVTGAKFLDLFCGSGAIGIEALSRGAGEAVFVDASKSAVGITQSNLAKVRLPGTVLHMNAVDAIIKLEQEGRVFDIIFLDPPYGLDLLNQALDALSRSNIISPETLIIAENAKGEQVATSLELQDIRAYGSTQLMFYMRTNSSATGDKSAQDQ